MQILQIGCGALGRMLAEATLAQQHALTVVRRSQGSVPVGAMALSMDVTHRNQCQALASISPDIVLYCLAPSESSDQAYQAIYADGFANVLNAISHTHLKHVFFISSTRVYGEQAGEWVDDETPAIPADAGGQALLAGEQCMQALPCGHTACRVSGIYGPDRRYLLQMAQSPSRWPQQANWSNRIHEADVVGALMHFYCQVALQYPANLSSQPAMHPQQIHGLPTHLILSDGVPTLQHAVLQWMAMQMDWPLPTTPPAMPQTGKRLKNQALLASGYRLQYADYQAGYAPMLASLQR